jgi:hypothetical protein
VKRPTSKRRSGYRHSIETSSRVNLSRRILTGKRRASRFYRLAKQRLAELEMDEETR